MLNQQNKSVREIQKIKSQTEKTKMGKTRTLATLQSQKSATRLLPLTQGRAFVKNLLDKAANDSKLTDFQISVLAACSCVPKGFVTTYGAIAKFIGSPQSSRAVGQALSINPFAPTVPCHRVVGSNRYLTGFQGEAGVSPKKVALLKAEGVEIEMKTGKVSQKNMIF